MKNNKLEFISMATPKKRNDGSFRKMAIFKCQCGSEKIYDYHAVVSNHTKQCNSCARKSAGRLKIKHNLIKHPLYRKWQDMKKRCYNKKVDRYNKYGGRGIEVCSEWKTDFMSFYTWCISNGYDKNLEIDRLNVNGNYEPNNCRFISKLENSFNKTNTFYVEVNGVKYSLSKLLFYNNCQSKYRNIWAGLKKGKSINHYIEKLKLKLYPQDLLL
jgi:hypothetical protein